MAAVQNQFERYFEYVLDKVAIKCEQKTIDEVKGSVKEMVSAQWDKALQTEGHFKLADVISVGSMTEGSRLHYPDEFDFMMILEMKNLPAASLTLAKCPSRPGYVRLYTNRGEKAGGIPGFEQNQLHSRKFRSHLLGYLQKVGDNSKGSEHMKQLKRDPSVLPEHYRKIFTSAIGEYEIDAWDMKFRWNGEMDVSVDTMPALEIDPAQLKALENSSGGIFRSDLGCDPEEVRKRAFHSGHCYLVPKQCERADDTCGCWLADFAPSEVPLMKSTDQMHKNCQKFLKYLFGNYSQHLPSYMVKTVVLEHTVNCKNARPTCALDILEHIKRCLDAANMPEPFLKGVNIFGLKTALSLENPKSIAILFEHYTRVSTLLLDQLQELSKIREQINYNDLVNKLLLRTCYLHFVDDFYEKLVSELKDDLDHYNITELRRASSGLKEVRFWDPIERWRKSNTRFGEQYPVLKRLLGLGDQKKSR